MTDYDRMQTRTLEEVQAAEIERLRAELADLRREYDLMEAERDAADDRRDEMVDDLEAERQRADSEFLRANKADAAIARVRARYALLTRYNQAPDYVLGSLMAALEGTDRS